MIFLTREMTRLDTTSTAVVERPIPMPLVTDVVTASVGHMPSIMIKMGFSVAIPLMIRSIATLFLFMLLPPYCAR